MALNARRVGQDWPSLQSKYDADMKRHRQRLLVLSPRYVSGTLCFLFFILSKPLGRTCDAPSSLSYLLRVSIFLMFCMAVRHSVLHLFRVGVLLYRTNQYRISNIKSVFALALHAICAVCCTRCEVPVRNWQVFMCQYVYG
jgi:hypothetical protein